MLSEEEQFSYLLEQSRQLFLEKFSHFVEVAKKSKISEEVLLTQGSGLVAFQMYDTSGVPLEVSQALAREHGFSISIDEFNQAMDKQRQRSREASLLKDGVFVQTDLQPDVQATNFLGYEGFDTSAKILKIFKDDKETGEAKQGEQVQIILDRSPFYAEAGGQVGDKGSIIKGKNVALMVCDTKRINEIIVHFAKVAKGKIKVGDEVKYKNFLFKITEATRRKINKVRLKKL